MMQAPPQPSTSRRTPEQWQQLVEEWRHSGESAKQFCTARSLGYASFCQWRKRLSASESATGRAKTTGADFIDLRDLSPVAAGNWHIVLKLGDGIELTLGQR